MHRDLNLGLSRATLSIAQPIRPLPPKGLCNSKSENSNGDKDKFPVRDAAIKPSGLVHVHPALKNSIAFKKTYCRFGGVTTRTQLASTTYVGTMRMPVF